MATLGRGLGSPGSSPFVRLLPPSSDENHELPDLLLEQQNYWGRKQKQNKTKPPNEPFFWSTVAVPMVLSLPAAKAHIYQFDNVSRRLDKNTNKPHGARHCVCKINQCAEATKSKTCYWLTIVCPEIKSRSVCGHQGTYLLPFFHPAELFSRANTDLAQAIYMSGSVTNGDSPYLEVTGHRREV